MQIIGSKSGIFYIFLTFERTGYRVYVAYRPSEHYIFPLRPCFFYLAAISAMVFAITVFTLERRAWVPMALSSVTAVSSASACCR